MSATVLSRAWPLERLPEALDALREHGRLGGTAAESTNAPAALGAASLAELGRWVDAQSATMGLESEAVSASLRDTDALLRRAAPALVMIPPSALGQALDDEGRQAPRFLALLGARGGSMRVVGPDRAIHKLPLSQVRRVLAAPHETPLVSECDELLSAAGVPERRLNHARDVLLGERLGPRPVTFAWILRLPPSASFRARARRLGLGRLALALASAHLVEYVLFIAAWWLIGQGALLGRVDDGWLSAWVLLLFTMVPFRLASTWAQGALALGAGALMKERLLAGALNFDSEKLRSEGAGQLLGRVIEAEAVESLALGAGFIGLLSLIELGLAVAVLAAGVAGGLLATLLVFFVAATLLLARGYARARAGWTDGRVTMTNDLVERMVGHRTRLAQESPGRWHDGEDAALEEHQQRSSRLDRAATRLMGLWPRLWLLTGIVAIAPSFVAGTTTAAALAVTFGGLILATQALSRLVTGLVQLAGAAVAWREVKPLFQAAGHTEPAASADFVLEPARGQRGERAAAPLVDARDLVYRYDGRAEPALRGCSVRIYPGDRVLLEGGSGGGKSTLASLLVGLRTPQQGLLLMGGLDRKTLGTSGWRRRVVAAPQFHENHVLAETFAFNLLMGRGSAPDADDYVEAETVCRELGLGELLSRMPAGLQQLVGETGWQLSHGEKSRLFIARAILQGAELVVLDESFAALDPETLKLALECVRRRARTLLVIAHT